MKLSPKKFSSSCSKMTSSNEGIPTMTNEKNTKANGIPSHTYVINKEPRTIAGISKMRSKLWNFVQSISDCAIIA